MSTGTGNDELGLLAQMARTLHDMHQAPPVGLPCKLCANRARAVLGVVRGFLRPVHDKAYGEWEYLNGQFESEVFDAQWMAERARREFAELADLISAAAGVTTADGGW